MQTALFCLLLAGVALAAGQKYTTQYDSINLDDILNNDRLYQKFFKCLANKGPCTPEAKKLKEIIPDALKDGCAKCNEKQKKGVEKGLRFVLEKKRADFAVLEKIYDPNGTYKKKYEAEAIKRGIKL